LINTKKTLKASSLYSIFSQMLKTFHSTVALQVGFFRSHTMAKDINNWLISDFFCTAVKYTIMRIKALQLLFHVLH